MNLFDDSKNNSEEKDNPNSEKSNERNNNQNFRNNDKQKSEQTSENYTERNRDKNNKISSPSDTAENIKVRRVDFDPQLADGDNVSFNSKQSDKDSVPSNSKQVDKGGVASNSKRDVKRRKSKTKSSRHGFRRFLISVLLIIVFVIGGLSIAGYAYYNPSTRISNLAPPKVVMFDLPLHDKDFRFDKDSLLISFEIIKSEIDNSIYREEMINKIVITTSDKVIEMDTGNLTAYINSKPFEIDVPVSTFDTMPFIPVDFLSVIYGLKIEKSSSGTIFIDNLKEPVLIMNVKTNDIFKKYTILQNIPFVSKSIFIREAPEFRSPRVKEVLPGEEVTVIGEEKNWYKIRKNDGVLGFMDKNNLILKEIIPAKIKIPQSKTSWKPSNGKINLTWDYMSKAKNDMSSYKSIPGLNVISPTWFHLTSGDGAIKSYASIPYMDWAHGQGLAVWPLFSNNFDPKITGIMLNSFNTRKKVIQQLLIFSETYGFDGINIDFEDVNFADKDLLTQFIREMTPYLHEKNLTVSMDVTIRSSNPNWSMVYDRVELGKVIDYMAVMTYDEHWGSSPISGSVASIPWVINGIERILEQVSKDKILMGVPFYTRIWEEKLQADGSVKVSSKAYSMPSIVKWMTGKYLTITKDDDALQNYVSYNENSIIYKIWLEDEYSMRQRIEIINDMDLAGVASWRKGFEEPYIWDIIKDELK